MKSTPKKSQKNRPKPLLPKIHIKIRDGQFHIPGMGAWYHYWRDPYHLLLTIPWSGYFLVVTSMYLGTNALFALLYMAGGNCVKNARPGSFIDLFFFSVQTLATIGYGAMYPTTIYANSIVTIEAMIGLVAVSVLTGLAFARFARPNARVMFSRVAVIVPNGEVPTLMFRAANQRRNFILQAQMGVYLMRDECTIQGDFIRRIYDLNLVRSQTPNFALSWVVVHQIDESSPLYGMTEESLIETNATIVIALSGIDETVAQIVHARHSYAAHEILWNHRFVDITFHPSAKHRYIDYNYFHDVLPLD